MAQAVKRLSTMQETWVRSLGREDPLEKEMPGKSHGQRSLVGYSPFHGVAQRRTWLSNFTFTLPAREMSAVVPWYLGRFPQQLLFSPHCPVHLDQRPAPRSWSNESQWERTKEDNMGKSFRFIHDLNFVLTWTACLVYPKDTVALTWGPLLF